MKIKHIVLASTILVSVSTFAQKDELKALKKIYSKDAPKPADVSEYKSNLIKLEGLATTEDDKIATGFYKAMSPLVEILSFGPTVTPAQKAQVVTAKTVVEIEKNLNATLDYEKKTGKKVFTDDILKKVELYKPDIINLAVELGQAKKYQEASDVINALYLLDKKDLDKLFFAASFAINAENYPKALEYYSELKKQKYTGVSEIFWATNKASKKEETFPSKAERDLFIKAGTHEKARNEKTESRLGEINKNIVLILMQMGKNNEAVTAIKEARQADPTDETLLFTEMDIYLKLNDFDSYTRLVNEALVKNPNDSKLIFNLGVISANAKKLDEAEKYYKKAIEVDPSYVDPYLNLSELKLRNDEKFVTEMNKLGTSDKDNKRYEVLKIERDKNFKSILPYLEKAVELDSNNETSKRTLISVYNALEMTDKAKALKATLK